METKLILGYIIGGIGVIVLIPSVLEIVTRDTPNLSSLSTGLILCIVGLLLISKYKKKQR